MKNTFKMLLNMPKINHHADDVCLLKILLVTRSSNVTEYFFSVEMGDADRGNKKGIS
jgi:hypothetical protein